MKNALPRFAVPSLAAVTIAVASVAFAQSGTSPSGTAQARAGEAPKSALFLPLAAAPAGAQISFKTQTFLETTAGIGDIVIADMNADSHPDIVLLEGRFGFPAEAFIEVLLNRGDGTFAPPLTIHLGTFSGLEFYVDELRVADFDGDADPDVAFIGTIAPLTLLFNDGAGNLGPPLVTTVTVDFGPLNALLDVGDLDSDGDTDIVVGTPMRIAFNEGPGQFSLVDLPVFSAHDQLGVADLTGDAIPDLAIGGRAHMNDGSGRFTEAGIFPGAGSFECAYTDLNADGSVDVACARFFRSELGVALNNGDATFIVAGPIPAEFPRGIAAGDLNADGHPDLAVRHDESASFFAGRGDGTFEDPQALDTPLGLGIAVGDLNADGIDDVVVGVGTTFFNGMGPAGVTVLISDRSPPPPCPGDINGDRMVGLGDVAEAINCWGEPASCNPAADLDASDSIGLGDLAVIINFWGTSCPM